MRMIELLKSVMMRKTRVQYLRRRMQKKVQQQSHHPGEYLYKARNEDMYLGSSMPLLQNPDELRKYYNHNSITADFIFIFVAV